MPNDAFGNLRDWGEVLDTLQTLTERRTLDQHQTGLARLIRYRDNWRLQQEGLRAATLVNMPALSLVEATMKVLNDPDALLENRILAARALGGMLARRRTSADEEGRPGEVTAAMKTLLNDGGPPIFHHAVKDACEQAGLEI